MDLTNKEMSHILRVVNSLGKPSAFLLIIISKLQSCEAIINNILWEMLNILWKLPVRL